MCLARIDTAVGAVTAQCVLSATMKAHRLPTRSLCSAPFWAARVDDCCCQQCFFNAITLLHDVLIGYCFAIALL